MVTDILGGAIPVGVDALPNSLPHVERGTLRALAITDAKRSRRIPDVPTMGEAVPGYAIGGTIRLGTRDSATPLACGDI